MELQTTAPSVDVLDSWKAIAQHLNRDIRTLQRWESTKSLPVHRMPGGDRPGVYALKSELDSWRRSRDIHLATPGEPAEGSAPETQLPSVAVLPFVNLTAGQENEFFGDGLADEIITALARIPGLRVTARTSSFAFRGKEQDIRKIASSLAAGAILEGSVRRSGDSVRVNAQLIDASNGYHLWSDRYDRELTETFRIQEDISQAIVEALRLRLVKSVPPVRRQTANPEAYQLWLRGRHYSIRRNPRDLLRSRSYFEQAAALDPQFAQAHVGIAESWWETAVFGIESPREAVAIGRCAVARALELDERSGEAHAMLGIYSGVHDFNWAEAERQFLRARELNPGSPDIRMKYAVYLLEPTRRFAEARAEFETALEFDPLSPVVLAHVGQCLLLERRYGEAVECLQEAAEIDPSYWVPQSVLFGAWAFQGRLDKSLEIAERAIVQLGPNPFLLGGAGIAYGLLGQSEKAKVYLRRIELLGETRYVSPLSIAWIHLGLRDVEQCLDWLERAVEERDPQIIHFPVKPLYDAFRGHPRFQALVERMGLAS
ncbi:MAG: tetratricopeptide repeat protein [Acidobacteriia bacterium]|nr:tetratricopeptide repeat protein [Terriglobia bacterium]